MRKRNSDVNFVILSKCVSERSNVEFSKNASFVDNPRGRQFWIL